MAVESTNISVVYTVTSAAEGQEFPIPFPYIEKEHVIAYYAVDEEVTNLTYGTDYTVNASTLTVTGTLPVGAKLVIHRVTPLTQEIVWVDGQAVYTPDIMQADDKLTFITQELREHVNRAVTVSPESERTPTEYSDDFFAMADQVRADATQVASDKQDVLDAVDGFDAHVEEKKGEIDDETTTQIDLVEDAGAAQISLIQAEGNTQVERVEDEGDTQVARVQTEGGAQVALAEGYAERAEAAAEEAEEIVHPTPATTEKLGLVQIGDGINVDSNGVISAQEVDIATTSTPGIVQIGDGIDIDANGVISAQEVDVATTSAPGIVQVGNGLSVTQEGVLSADIATTQTAGIVKVGDNLSITPDGTLSADAQGGSTYTVAITDLDVADYADGTMVVTSESVDSDDSVLGGVPVGTIIWSMKATVPAGYLLCNGSAVGRETYPELFQAIGTAFGSGDGSTTFNLPNLIDKFIEGGNSAGTVKAAGLPNITASGGSHIDPEVLTGAFTTGTNNQMTGAGWAIVSDGLSFDASQSNAIYGASNTVQPPAVTALPCIKAFASVIGDATVVASQLVNEIQSKVALDGSNLASSAGSVLKEYMAHMGMPSGRYIDLTVQSINTAPADGYVVFAQLSTAVGQLFDLNNTATGLNVREVSSVANLGYWGIIPVSKGDTITLNSTMAGTVVMYRLIYANGSAPTA